MHARRAHGAPAAAAAERRTPRRSGAQIASRRACMLVEPRELVQADRRLQVHHVVLEAGHHDVVVRVRRRARSASRRRGSCRAATRCASNAAAARVVGRHHPAFAGRQVLGRVEAEAGEVADRRRPCGRSATPSTQCAASSISVRPRGARHAAQRRHVGRPAGVVHRQQRARARRHAPRRRPRVEIARVAGSMSANTGVAPACTIDVRGRTERQRRRDDLVAGADAGGEQRQMQRGGAGVDARPRARRRRRRRTPARSRARADRSTASPTRASRRPRRSRPGRSRAARTGRRSCAACSAADVTRF